MPIPAFTIDRVLPPFVGPHGPGGSHQDLSPYAATAVEVVDRFATTQRRCEILRGYLDHRAAMRGIGIVDGFQWLDGSFVEDKTPRDIDIVTFFRRPANASLVAQIGHLAAANPNIFNRAAIKAHHHLDAFFVDLDGKAESIVELTRYFGGLFSHRRDDFLWKGMIKVSLASVDDAVALALLNGKAANLQQVGP